MTTVPSLHSLNVCHGIAAEEWHRREEAVRQLLARLKEEVAAWKAVGRTAARLEREILARQRALRRGG